MFSLRLARRADLPAIVEIYNSTIASRQVTADLTPVTTDDRLAWFEAHQRPERPLWIATQSGAASDPTILGWMSLSDFHPRAAYGHTAEISVYCREEARGHGLGSFLVRQAMDYAPGVGVKTLIGLVFGHNSPSLALFARCGFEVQGHLKRVAELDGVERDLVFVSKRLVP